MGIGPGWSRLGVAALAALAALAVGTHEGAAQRTADRASVVIERFIGTWDLVDWRATTPDGAVRFPYGEEPGGQLVYTSAGRMSAHLMRPPEDPSDAPPQHAAYWGTFSLDVAAETVTHHVIGSSQANWIGSNQVRGFRFESDDRLVLSLGSNRLTWVRVPTT